MFSLFANRSLSEDRLEILRVDCRACRGFTRKLACVCVAVTVCNHILLFAAKQQSHSCESCYILSNNGWDAYLHDNRKILCYFRDSQIYHNSQS